MRIMIRARFLLGAATLSLTPRRSSCFFTLPSHHTRSMFGRSLSPRHHNDMPSATISHGRKKQSWQCHGEDCSIPRRSFQRHASSLVSTEKDDQMDDSKNKTKKIYVGNLSETTTCEGLVRHFKEFLDNDDDDTDACACDLMTDRNTGASRGYAFVTLTKDNAERLLSERTAPMILDGHELILGENFSRGLRRPFRPLSIGEGGLQNGKIQKRTPYTIDDNDCPPTDDVMLQKIVSKHCRTLDRYLSARPVAQHTAAAFAETKIFVTNFLKQDSSRGIILDR
eukprot:scaffold33611_cov39-Attheya_sp.AAC.1